MSVYETGAEEAAYEKGFEHGEEYGESNERDGILDLLEEYVIHCDQKYAAGIHKAMEVIRDQKLEEDEY